MTVLLVILSMIVQQVRPTSVNAVLDQLNYVVNRKLELMPLSEWGSLRGVLWTGGSVLIIDVEIIPISVLSIATVAITLSTRSRQRGGLDLLPLAMPQQRTHL